MYLDQISLTNFRNYTRLALDLPQHTTVLQGANAQGKTNLLEAIYFLAVGRSPYATSDAQLVNWLASHDELPYARIDAQLRRGQTQTRIEIILTRSVNGRSGYRKHIRINGVAKRAMDLLGHANVVLFVPQDIGLIDGPPESRRRYLNSTICQIDPQYCRTLSQYSRILERRNHLLRALRDRGGATDQLAFWDEKLALAGARIIARRQEITIELERLAQPLHSDLSGGQERLRLRYIPSLDPNAPPDDNLQLSLDLDLTPPISQPRDPETIRMAFQERLLSTQRADIRRGITSVGPHRDELRFSDGQVDLHVYGSRGQQRTSVLALKLAEVTLMAQITGEQPILLLDDVMSELDSARRQYLCAQLDRVEQSVITTTDLHDLTANVLRRASLYHVSGGNVKWVQSRENEGAAENLPSPQQPGSLPQAATG